MTTYRAIAFVVNIGIALGLAFALYALLQQSLRVVLDRVIRLPAGTAFYLRALLLIFFLVALSATVNSPFDLKPDAHFMQYVWLIAADMARFFENVFWGLMAYLAMVTVLLVVLKVKNE
jgi:hypothetical protein